MPTARPRTPAPVPGATPLLDAEALRQADGVATGRYGIPSVLLMERAGLETAREILARHPGARRAVVLVGPGNNGGDGMVVARHLSEAGWRVEILSADGRAPRTPDAHLMSNVAMALGLPLRPFDRGARPPEGAVVVDALLGTGARGAPREATAAMVEWAAGARGPVVALDVPTGVDADSGRVEGSAVRAALTVTFHGDVVGLRVAPGRAHAGEVVVADIGIPGAVTAAPAAWLAGAEAARAIPAKDPGGDKYRAGAVLVVAGAPGLTGAAQMSARAALRAGAGLVVAAVPAPVQPLVAMGAPEVMVAGVAHRDGHLGPESKEDVLAQAGRVTALALGPGVGRMDATGDALLGVLAGTDLPAVVDADGLWHLRDRLDHLHGRRGATVLTPHAGEAARLLGVAREEVEAGRIDAARALAIASQAVVVLKGPGTLVVDPAGTVVVAAGGGPELATAGSGDVLTGVVAAALGKRLPPLVAAAAGVALHAAAGTLAGKGDGTVAGDVLEALPAALALVRGTA